MTQAKEPAGAPDQAAETSMAELRERARKLSNQALTTLDGLMSGSGQDAVKLAAAREVLDRVHGKAKAIGEEPAAEGLTVVIRRFGDEPDEDGGSAPGEAE